MTATVLLDGNIYNALATDDETRNRLRTLTDAGTVRVIATSLLVEELAASSFGGVPAWFSVEVIPDRVSVIGHGRIGSTSHIGEGAIYNAHRGNKQKRFKDSILAEAASADADVLVSNDNTFRKQFARLTTRCHAITFDEFRAWLSNIESEKGDA